MKELKIKSIQLLHRISLYVAFLIRSFLQVHVRPQAVLIAVDFVAYRTDSLGRSTTLIVISRDVDIEAVLILHLAIAPITTESLVVIPLEASLDSTHPGQGCSCNREH